MKHVHAGFTLIELIIAVALSSIVSLVLINALYQMSRFRTTVDERVSVYSHAAIIQQQLERDITSAFIPDLVKTSTKSQEEAGTNQARAGNQNQAESEKNSAQKPGTDSVNQGESEQKDELKKWFYGAKSGENFDLLTCITTSPLPGYWGAKSGKPRVRIARVLYRLQRDSERPDSYILYRQEGAELDFASYHENGPRNFVVAKDIKSMTIIYEAEIKHAKPEDKKSLAGGTAPAGAQAAAGAAQSAEKGAQESAPEYKLFPEWDSDKLTKNKRGDPPVYAKGYAGLASIQTQAVPAIALAAAGRAGEGNTETQDISSRIPHSVSIELRLWNPEHTRDRLFKFVYTVMWQDTKNKASSAPSAEPTDKAAGQTGTSTPSTTASGATGSAAGAPSSASSQAGSANGAGSPVKSGVSSGVKNSTAGLFVPQAQIVAREQRPTRSVSRSPGETQRNALRAEPAADMLVHVEQVEIVGV